jgi:hypothetical protein
MGGTVALGEIKPPAKLGALIEQAAQADDCELAVVLVATLRAGLIEQDLTPVFAVDARDGFAPCHALAEYRERLTVRVRTAPRHSLRLRVNVRDMLLRCFDRSADRRRWAMREELGRWLFTRHDLRPVVG